MSRFMADPGSVRLPGAWCLVPGAWCLVPGAWCLVPGDFVEEFANKLPLRLVPGAGCAGADGECCNRPTTYPAPVSRK